MDTFISKIFNGKFDEDVHLNIKKFSRGEFKNKARVNATYSKGVYTISTTYEYARDLVKNISSKIPEEKKVIVSGAIICTSDLEGKLEYKTKKQFMGIKQYILEKEMSKEEIISLCDNFPNAFLGISFSINGTELKIKAKAPKSAKPSSLGEKNSKPDFCKIKTNDKEIAESILFGVGEFKKAEISHDFIINEIIIPKNESDPEKMRELAIRRGVLIRRVIVDGKEKRAEAKFEA